MKPCAGIIFSLAAVFSHAQKIDSIYFHLYTDSLKKGFYNYINVDGKTSDGRWLPLTSKEINFTSSGGHFRNNDLFIDSSYNKDFITIRAELKSNPAVWKETIIYLRKLSFEPLKTNEEIFHGKKRQRLKQRTDPAKHSSLHLP